MKHREHPSALRDKASTVIGLWRKALVSAVMVGQSCLSTHALHKSSPYCSACFLDLKVRRLDSIRLISMVWFRSRSKTSPPEYHWFSWVLELPLHKSDGLCIGSWPSCPDQWRTYISAQCTESRLVREILIDGQTWWDRQCDGLLAVVTEGAKPSCPLNVILIVFL